MSSYCNGLIATSDKELHTCYSFLVLGYMNATQLMHDMWEGQEVYMPIYGIGMMHKRIFEHWELFAQVQVFLMKHERSRNHVLKCNSLYLKRHINPISLWVYSGLIRAL